MLLPGADGPETLRHHPLTTHPEAPPTDSTQHSTTSAFLLKASAIALTAIIHIILAFVCKHHTGPQEEVIFRLRPLRYHCQVPHRTSP